MIVRTVETMGTVVSVRSATAAAAAGVRAVFAAYDRRYSLYDPDSVLSRIAAGALRLRDAPAEVRDTYALALAWRDRTGGAFTPHRPDGVIDLSGVVKALAVRDAGAVLDRSASAWMISAGGDVLVRGRHGDLAPGDSDATHRHGDLAPRHIDAAHRHGDLAPRDSDATGHHGDPWRVGIVDPADRDRVVGVVDLDPRRAVATSGTAERGEHIWRRSAPVFTQATAIADDIVTADVIATTVVAGDEDDLRRLTADGGVDVVAFAVDGTVWATPGATAAVTVDH